jgi:CRP-like cAMP-binding protein
MTGIGGSGGGKPRMRHLPGAAWPRPTLLGRLPPGPREDLLHLGTLVRYQEDERIILEGDESTHVMLLLDGLVKIMAETPVGGEALLAVRSGGDVVGELAALDEQPRSATVIAATALVVRRIAQDEFVRWLGRHPAAALEVHRAIAGKLRWAARRRTHFASGSIPVRVACVLVELARRYGEETAEGLRIAIPLTQQNIAALVGASPRSVERALASLRARLLIKVAYRGQVVLDIATLDAIATSNSDPGGSAAG